MAFDWLTVAKMTLVVMAWSRLYRENVFYRISENLIVGWLIGFSFIQNMQILNTRIYIPLVVEGKLGVTIIPLLLGILYWIRPFKQTQWLSRWPISLMTGIASAIAVKGAIYAELISLVTTRNFLAPGVDATGVPNGVNNLIIFLFTLCCMAYFTFTYKHTGALGTVANVGLYMLMLSFGWAAGTYLMSLTSMSIGHMQDLMRVPGIYVSAISIAILIITILNDSNIIHLTKTSTTTE